MAPRPISPRWNEQLQGMRNPDGTWGEGPAQAYATGGAGAAVLRMGLKLDKRDAVIAALKAGQRRKGAGRRTPGRLTWEPPTASCGRFTCFTKSPTSSDCWRSSPAAASPTAATRASPAATGDLGGTYTATIVIYWVRQLLGLPAVVETAGFTPLVNGKDLTGWEGDTQLWSNKDGVLDRPLAGAQSQRVPVDDRDLWRLRPLALLPDDRRQGE